MFKNGVSKLIFALFVFSTVGTSIAPVPVHAQEAPATFSPSTVADNLTVPVAMQFAPDGTIFVAEKYGDIKVINADGSASTFGSLAVNGDYEQGLLGFVFDPNFATNGYIYVAYTRPDGDFNRVSRVTASAANHRVMQAGSEKVLLDNIPSPTGIHQMGDMHVGKDGKLYIASGDGALESQSSGDLNTLGGKFLRINLDGSIPADNPFVNQAGKRGEIWAYGLRNPYSSGMQESTGRMFINDVGRDTWEEINDLQKGANYGYPVCEGKCIPVRADYTDPIYQYSHYDGPVVGRSITAGAWYEGNVYPADFQGDYIFADYVAGWIKRIDPVTKQVSDIASGFGGIVNAKVGPDGLLYMVLLDVNTGSGTVKKLNYGIPPAPSGTKQLKVYAAGTPAAAQYPTMQIMVDDKVVATHANVQGNPYNRQFTEYTYEYSGDLTPAQVKVNFSNDALVNGEDRNLYVDKIVLNGATTESEDSSILSTGSWAPDSGCNPGNKQTELLACGGYFQYGQVATAANQKPTAEIVSPVAETHYNAGTTVNFSGKGADAEDGNLAANKLSWNIVFHHDTHTHPFLNFNNTDNGSFTIPDNAEPAADTFYRLQLTATDANGQTTMVSRDIYPNVVKLGLNTTIPGLSLNLDGAPRTTPLSINAVTGFKRGIGAPLTQTVDGKTYDFVNWSDGGAADHTITTPAQDTTYLATYKLRDGATTPPPAKTVIKIYAAGSPAQGVYPTMDLQIDGQTVATYTDVRGNAGGRQFTEYTYTSDKDITASNVRLNFTNDALVNGEDRNLYVDKISINGTTYESEDQTTLSTGTWTPQNGCAPGNKRSETLSCGGYFQYGSGTTTPPPAAQGSTVSIYAAGSPAQGVYPTMNLLIDGKMVTAYADIRGNYNNRQFIKYDYVSPVALTAKQIQLDFVNDAFINGEDRNLYVDKISLDGQTYEAEAPSTYSLGSWNAATGCDAGYKSSEALSCNGYFRFQ